MNSFILVYLISKYCNILTQIWKLHRYRSIFKISKNISYFHFFPLLFCTLFSFVLYCSVLLFSSIMFSTILNSQCNRKLAHNYLETHNSNLSRLYVLLSPSSFYQFVYSSSFLYFSLPRLERSFVTVEKEKMNFLTWRLSAIFSCSFQRGQLVEVKVKVSSLK